MSKKSKIIVACVIIGLVIAVMFQELRYRSLKYDSLYEKTVPDIELWHIQSERNGDMELDVRGFVAFDNLADQPKNMRQYYVIKSTSNLDANGNQIYSLGEIISMDLVPPREFDTILLTEQSNDGSKLVLVDEVGNRFILDKIREKVSLLDMTGDSTHLITNMSEYRDFMRSFLSQN